MAKMKSEFMKGVICSIIIVLSHYKVECAIRTVKLFSKNEFNINFNSSTLAKNSSQIKKAGAQNKYKVKDEVRIPDVKDVSSYIQSGAGNDMMFWAYYNAAGGSTLAQRGAPNTQPYFRRSPLPWHGLPMSRNINQDNVMVLGDWLSLSKGPRRRKKRSLGTIKDFLHVPLFCWKMIVNCRIFPSHVCCPVMVKSSSVPKKRKYRRRRRRGPKKSKKRPTKFKAGKSWRFQAASRSNDDLGIYQRLKRLTDSLRLKIGQTEEESERKRKLKKRSTKIRHYDPLFGIPIEVGPEIEKKLNGKSGRVNDKEEDKVAWSESHPPPKYSQDGVVTTELSSLPFAKTDSIQSRCMIDPEDCRLLVPDHPCCSYLRRTLSFSPMVHPSLFENWVTAVFEFGSKHPLAFTGIKNFALVTMLLSMVSIWSWIGHQVGYLGGERDDADRQLARRIDEVMGSVVNLQEKLSAGDQEEDEGDEGKVKSGGIIEWLMSSLKSSSVKRKSDGYSKFLCCFVDSNSSDSGHNVSSQLTGGSEDVSNSREREGQSSSFQCYPKTNQKVVNSRVQDALQCVSDLIYEIILDSN